jgi:hypothetical protein
MFNNMTWILSNFETPEFRVAVLCWQTIIVECQKSSHSPEFRPILSSKPSCNQIFSHVKIPSSIPISDHQFNIYLDSLSNILGWKLGWINLSFPLAEMGIPSFRCHQNTRTPKQM